MLCFSEENASAQIASLSTVNGLAENNILNSIKDTILSDIIQIKESTDKKIEELAKQYEKQKNELEKFYEQKFNEIITQRSDLVKSINNLKNALSIESNVNTETNNNATQTDVTTDKSKDSNNFNGDYFETFSTKLQEQGISYLSFAEYKYQQYLEHKFDETKINEITAIDGQKNDKIEFAVGDINGTIAIHNENEKVDAILKGHTGKITNLLYHPKKANTIITGSTDSTIRLWNSEE